MPTYLLHVLPLFVQTLNIIDRDREEVRRMWFDLE
jgi:hypothetical protein